jgi:hypothetical protein
MSGYSRNQRILLHKPFSEKLLTCLVINVLRFFKTEIPTKGC